MVVICLDWIATFVVEWDEMEESDLILRSQEGDLDAFNQLVERNQRAIYNLALRMMGNAPAAEDATQEALLSAFKGIGRFRGGNFRAWLLRIVANTCRDHLRSWRRRPATSLDALVLEPERDAPSPEDYALRRELGEEIGKALGTLSADQRLAVILYDIQGLSYEEVALVMNSSLGTVKSRLSRGRARLRLIMAKYMEPLP